MYIFREYYVNDYNNQDYTRKEMGMEINFEKIDITLYTLIVAATHHIFTNINIICGDIIKSIWPVNAIILILTLKSSKKNEISAKPLDFTKLHKRFKHIS